MKPWRRPRELLVGGDEDVAVARLDHVPIVVDLVAANTMSKDHRHWRFCLFVAGKDL